MFARKFSRRALSVGAVVAVLLLVVAPAVLSMHWINNLGKYCCWAIAAVGIAALELAAIAVGLLHQRIPRRRIVVLGHRAAGEDEAGEGGASLSHSRT